MRRRAEPGTSPMFLDWTECVGEEPGELRVGSVWYGLNLRVPWDFPLEMCSRQQKAGDGRSQGWRQQLESN